MKPRSFLVVLLVAIGLTGAAVWRQLEQGGSPQSFAVQGETMGTTYHVKYQGRNPPLPEAMKARIDQRLHGINRSMSTWDPTSEISRINGLPAGEPIAVSPDFRSVLTVAQQLSAQTGGAFDVTVGPLVNLWGYGPQALKSEPTPAEIAAAEHRVGFRKLTLNGDRLTKRANGIYLDFSAIAKGYGVDAVGQVLESQGISNYIVEIGGEVVARGHNLAGQPWSVGIDRPVEGAAEGASLYAVVRLSQGALATSGSYRRFRHYRHGESTHIIDPRTGMPTVSALVSVTVYAPDCTHADGIATALMVMGVKEGLTWVEHQPGVEALFLDARPDDGFDQRLSSGFARLLR